MFYPRLRGGQARGGLWKGSGHNRSGGKFKVRGTKCWTVRLRCGAAQPSTPAAWQQKQESQQAASLSGPELAEVISMAEPHDRETKHCRETHAVCTHTATRAQARIRPNPRLSRQSILKTVYSDGKPHRTMGCHSGMHLAKLGDSTLSRCGFRVKWPTARGSTEGPAYL